MSDINCTRSLISSTLAVGAAAGTAYMLYNSPSMRASTEKIFYVGSALFMGLHFANNNKVLAGCTLLAAGVGGMLLYSNICPEATDYAQHTFIFLKYVIRAIG